MSQTSTVMQPLTVEQRAEKGDEMASLVAQIALSHRRGRVIAWGWTPWDDGTGRTVRVRAVRVAYGELEVLHRAEMRVLVPAERPHVVLSDETRWSELLPEPLAPGKIGALGEVARVRRG